MSAEGVFLEGLSTSLDASRRVTLRVGRSPKGRTDLDRGEVLQAAAEEGGSSSVDMGDWGVRVSPSRIEKNNSDT